MKKTTMKDIAKLANVSVATVSYVLNNVANQTIPHQTRSLILNIAKELNYVPNLAARSLIKQKSGLVGILMNKQSMQPFWKQFSQQAFLNELEKLLTHAGYHTLIVSIDVSNPSLDIIRERKLDAVFLIDISDSIFYNISSQFVEGIPLILIDSLVNDNLFNQIVFDYEAAISEAAKHMNSDAYLVMESFCNQALLQDIQQKSGLPLERIFVAESIEALNHFIDNTSCKNIIVINEFLGNYLDHAQKFDQIIVICTCQCPELLSPALEKVSFENNKSLLAFELMEKLITTVDYTPFSENTFVIKVSN